MKRCVGCRPASAMRVPVIFAAVVCCLPSHYSHAFYAEDGPSVRIDIECPRRAFYRGEEILLVAEVVNETTEALQDLTLEAGIGFFPPPLPTHVAELPDEGSVTRSFRLQTVACASDHYELIARLSGKQGPIAEVRSPIVIAPVPNPDRLLVWLWGGGGGKWYLDHGFNTWSGASWSNPSAAKKTLDEALVHGAAAVVRPNGGLRDIDPKQFEDPDATNLGVRERLAGTIANPLHPEVARLQDDVNEKLMEFVREYPQVKTAFFNTEIVDSLHNNKNKKGLELTREELGFTEEDIGPPQFVAPGVIADDDKKYLFHKYRYKQGNGLGAANKRTVDMIHRYRPDILTFTDPYRETSLYDLYPGLDVVGTWTYTNPDPKLMLYVETLRTVCKPTAQKFVSTVTLLNYPGELAPTEEWMLMGPGRTKVTTWINLSRAPEILGYYYSSACPPTATDTFEIPYSTSVALKELSEKVFKPYGPMISNLEVEPRRIAVLSSAAARVHGKSPRLRGGYANMQPYHFYTVMAMAHLQADVLFDESVERYGLDDYDVLVLPKCDVLTKTVYDTILAFRKRGGIVVADQYLGPEIPGVITFDFDFTYRAKVTADAIAKNVAYAEWDDHLQPGSAELQKVEGVTALDDQRIMESFAKELKEGLAGVVEADVDCDSPTVLFNMLEKNGVKYLFVINDKRTYDDRIGKHKSVLGKILPQRADVELKQWGHPELHAYDMLERKPIELRKTETGHRFSLELSELGGKIVALYPKKLESVEIDVPERMKPGQSCGITVILKDDGSNLARGLQPLKIRITRPNGSENEYSGYYCAKDGVLRIDFIPALNDPVGDWKLSALDLTAGLEGKKSFRVE